MKLVLDDKTFRMILIGVGIIVVLITFVILRSRSRFVYPESTAPTGSPASGAYATFVNAINGCATTLTNSKISLGIPDNITTSAAAAAGSYSTQPFITSDTCIATATNTYLTNRCPQILSSYVDTGAAKTTYDNTVIAIRQAYSSRFTDADNGSFASASFSSSTINAEHKPNYSSGTLTGYTQDTIGTPATSYAAYVVRKARDADLAGATRRYIAESCQGYYNVNISTGSATFGLSDLYRDWDFNSAAVTNANIITWAKRAGFITSVTNTTVGTAGPLYKYQTGATNPLPTVTNGGTYNGATATVSDIDKSTNDSTNSAQTVYKVARYNGPGSTVKSSPTYSAAAAVMPTPA
jgi:hypothetical protein